MRPNEVCVDRVQHGAVIDGAVSPGVKGGVADADGGGAVLDLQHE